MAAQHSPSRNDDADGNVRRSCHGEHHLCDDKQLVSYMEMAATYWIGAGTYLLIMDQSQRN